MKYVITFADNLRTVGKWRAELFIDQGHANEYKNNLLVEIGEIAHESTSATMPEELDGDQVLYVGLENVEQVTGMPLSLNQQSKTNIKSRSKLFSKNQILYGRLRPYLRKAMLAGGKHSSGICSTEFIVIEPNIKRVLPEYLRLVLVSKFATNQLTRFQTGASLPRISARDLFSIKVPVPSIQRQRGIVKHYESQRVKYLNAIKVVQEFPVFIDKLTLSLA